MSSHNKHDKIAREYLQSLGQEIKCIKDKCQGRLIPVLVSYKPGETREELECTACGKAIRQNISRFLSRTDDKITQEPKHATFYIPRPPPRSKWKGRDR